MSNSFFDTAYNDFECGLLEYQNIMDNVDVVDLVQLDDKFYKITNHPVIHDIFVNEEFDVDVDNPEYIVYKSGNNYHIYIQRTDNDMTGWVYYSNNENVESLGSVPIEYLDSDAIPFSNFNVQSRGQINDIESDNPEKVFDLILESIIL